MLVYGRRAIKQPTSTTATSEGITQAINTQPIRKFCGNHANAYVISQGHGLCVHVHTLPGESRMGYYERRYFRMYAFSRI